MTGWFLTDTAAHVYVAWYATLGITVYTVSLSQACFTRGAVSYVFYVNSVRRRAAAAASRSRRAESEFRGTTPVDTSRWLCATSQPRDENKPCRRQLDNGVKSNTSERRESDTSVRFWRASRASKCVPHVSNLFVAHTRAGLRKPPPPFPLWVCLRSNCAFCFAAPRSFAVGRPEISAVASECFGARERG